MVRTWAANVVGCPNVGQSVDGLDVGWFVGGEVVGCVDVGRLVDCSAWADLCRSRRSRGLCRCCLIVVL